MNRTAAWILASALVLAALVWSLREPPLSVDDNSQSLTVFCAASNRAVMEAIRADYEAETGVSVAIQYGPSQTLLSSIEVSGTGDLYLPADASYLEMGREKTLIEESIPLAEMNAVLAVRKDDVDRFQSFDDLFADGVRFVQASPDAAAIGMQTRQVLQAQSLWERADQGTAAYRTTVIDVANDVKVGAADVGILYNAVLHLYPELVGVAIPELQDAEADIAVGVIASSRQPQRALHFARYLAARDRGSKRYNEYGFRSGGGDPWAAKPEVTLFAGSMLRPAIEETIQAFEQREGVTVNRVYNGCGILVGQMRSGREPDAYFACDVEFMNQVDDLFTPPLQVSQNELVMLVPKGNPHEIASLADLARAGLRVGIGHEEQCAMGWLTQAMLKKSGVHEEVMANVAVQSPTGDMLVNQLRAGSLDVAIAYLSNAANSAELLDAIRLQEAPSSIAEQPFATAKTSRYPQLLGRLLDRLGKGQSKQRFLREGFTWKLDEADE